MARSRIRLLYGLQGTALGVVLPFLVPLLSTRGLGPAGIGFVLGLASLASLLAYPAWGVLADVRIGRPRTISAAALAAALGGLVLLTGGSDAVALAVGVSLTVMGGTAWGPVNDAIALESLGDEPTAYGPLRAFSSLGWAIAAPLAGAAWVWVGPIPVLWTFVALALLMAAVGLGLPVRVPTGRARPAPELDEDQAIVVEPLPTSAEPLAPPAGAADLRGWREALTAPVLLGFLVGLMLMGMGAHAAWSFIGLRILDEGGGTFLVGIAAALPAIVEVPVFGASRPLADRLGLRLLFVTGALLSAATLVLIAAASQAWLMAVVRSADGVAYPLRYLATVLIVGALLPPRMRTTGQSLAWLVAAGIAPVIGDPLAGLVYAAFGGGALFLACAAVEVAGATVVAVVLRGRVFAARRTAAVGSSG